MIGGIKVPSNTTVFKGLLIFGSFSLAAFIGFSVRPNYSILPYRVQQIQDVYKIKNGTSPSPPLPPSKRTTTTPATTTTVQINKSPLRLISPGETLQAGNLEVYIPTAVYYDNRTLFLNGWAKWQSNMTFKCCLLRTLSDLSIATQKFTEIPAEIFHVYKQWIVDMQGAQFTCQVPNLKNMNGTFFKYVAFARESCSKNISEVLEILYPQPVPQSVGVCLKITYGTLNPSKMVEWFEYSRLMNVTRVFTYYYDVDPQVLKVLQYYKDIGFLDLLPLHPGVPKNGKPRRFRPPRYHEQAWVDEVMAANDCKHRMRTFDFVIIMDMDEFIIPVNGLKSYYDVLRATRNMRPAAAGYRFDSYTVVLSWGESRSSPLHLARYTRRLQKANPRNAGEDTRWGFRPAMTSWVQNNLVHPKPGAKIVIVPFKFCRLLHYRICKVGAREIVQRRRK